MFTRTAALMSRIDGWACVAKNTLSGGAAGEASMPGRRGRVAQCQAAV